MARSKQSKHAIIEQLKERFDRSTSVIFANFQGLKVKEAEELRKLCRDGNSECVMAKKTLFSRVLESKGVSEINAKNLQGEVVAVFGYGDEVAPARILAFYSKTHEALRLLAGLVMTAPRESRALDAARVQQLAKLPSRDELRATLLRLFMAPPTTLVRLMKTPSQQLVQVLNAKMQQS